MSVRLTSHRLSVGPIHRGEDIAAIDVLYFLAIRPTTLSYDSIGTQGGPRSSCRFARGSSRLERSLRPRSLALGPVDSFVSRALLPVSTSNLRSLRYGQVQGGTETFQDRSKLWSILPGQKGPGDARFQ
jgi:hypothetical protein